MAGARLLRRALLLLLERPHLRIGPAGREQRDSYGRLLCHVILADGRDFNLLLVEEGKSPYFNKYGNSLVAHAAFVAAQQHAREKSKGIWDPTTNVPKDPKAPIAAGPAGSPYLPGALGFPPNLNGNRVLPPTTPASP